MNGDARKWMLDDDFAGALRSGAKPALAERVCLTGPDRPARYYFWKRLIDVVISASLLIALAPVFAIIAVWIKIDSSGPVVFLQNRAGSRRTGGSQRGDWRVEAFRCYKFRSMFEHADDAAHRAYTAAFIRGESLASSADRPLYKLVGDPRVTRAGRLLRRTSLDELPQLINVLLGQMSLVGPRPVPTYELAAYRAHHWRRLTAKPGLTGLWQVKGRCRVDFEGMLRMDLEYIHNQSLWNDLKILLQTVPAVVLRKGAE